MLIYHEDMAEEAITLARALKEVYNIDSEVVDVDLETAFTPIPEFNGFASSSMGIREFLENIQGCGWGEMKPSIVLTSRDIYINKLSEDNWVFGYNQGDLSVVSSARMKRKDSKFSDVRSVDKELYLERLVVLGIHEIGHNVINDDHMLPATYINPKTGQDMSLGNHCTDNTCAMYEIIDITAPNPEESYMLLGDEKKFDAGLDDVVRRLRQGFLCNRCKTSIKRGKL